MEILFNENRITEAFNKFIEENTKFVFKHDQSENIVKELPIIAAYLLGSQKSTDHTYVLEIESMDARTMGETIFHFGVKYNKGDSVDDPGNFSIICGFGPHIAIEGELVVKNGLKTSNYINRLMVQYTKNYGYKIDPINMEVIVSTAFEFFGSYLKQSIMENEPFSIIIPGVIQFTIIPTGELVAIADQEVKKRIKSDAMLEAAKQ